MASFLLFAQREEDAASAARAKNKLLEFLKQARGLGNKPDAVDAEDLALVVIEFCSVDVTAEQIRMTLASRPTKRAKGGQGGGPAPALPPAGPEAALVASSSSTTAVAPHEQQQ